MKVIKLDNMPSRLPVLHTVSGWLFFDRIGIPGWGWGVFWTIAAILWIVCIVAVYHQEYSEVVFK